MSLEFAYGRFFFGCDGERPRVLVASPDLRFVERLENARVTNGIAQGPGGMLLIGYDRALDGEHRGGLRVLPTSQLWY